MAAVEHPCRFRANSRSERRLERCYCSVIRRSSRAVSRHWWRSGFRLTAGSGTRHWNVSGPPTWNAMTSRLFERGTVVAAGWRQGGGGCVCMMELLAVRVVDGPITRPCYFATGTIGIVLAFRAPTREPTFAAWACLASFSSSALVIDCKKAEGGGG